MKRTVVMFLIVTFFTCFMTITYANPVLKLGTQGNSVEVLQRALLKEGVYKGKITGIFDPATESAVVAFQTKYRLVVDGIVGSQTWAYVVRSADRPSRYNRELTMSASAYSAYDPGNSSYTCRGNLLCKGLVAVDPSVIPLGTRLYISGYGHAIADDIGGSIKGHTIDLAFDSHEEAILFGRQNVIVYILD